MVAGGNTWSSGVDHVDEPAEHDRVFIGGNYGKRKIQQKKIHTDGRSKEVCSTAETHGIHLPMLRRHSIGGSLRWIDKGRVPCQRYESI